LGVVDAVVVLAVDLDGWVPAVMVAIAPFDVVDSEDVAGRTSVYALSWKGVLDDFSAAIAVDIIWVAGDWVVVGWIICWNTSDGIIVWVSLDWRILWDRIISEWVILDWLVDRVWVLFDRRVISERIKINDAWILRILGLWQSSDEAGA